MKPWIEELKKLNACKEALEWCETQDSLEAAWKNCECVGWMEWLLDLRGWPEGSMAIYIKRREAAQAIYIKRREAAWAIYDKRRAAILRSIVKTADITKGGAA